MPAPLTSFVGRRAELAALDDAVAASRLTSVVGPGGRRQDPAGAGARPPPGRAGRGVVRRAGAGAPAGGGRRGHRRRGRRPGAGGGRRPARRRRPSSGPSTASASATRSSCSTTASTSRPAAADVRARAAGRLPRAAHRDHEPGAARRRGRAPGRLGPLGDDESARAVRRAGPRRAAAVHRPAAATTELVELCRHLDGLPAGHRARRGARQDAARARDRRPPARPLPAAAAHPARRARRATRAWRRRSTGATTCCSTTSGGRSGAWRCSPAGPRSRPPSGCAVPTRSSSPAGWSTARCSSPTPPGASTRFAMLESLRGLRAAAARRGGRAGRRPAPITCAGASSSPSASTSRSRGRRPAALARSPRRRARQHPRRARLRRRARSGRRAAARRRRVILPWWFRGRRQETRHWIEASLAAGRRRRAGAAGPGAGVGAGCWPSRPARRSVEDGAGDELPSTTSWRSPSVRQREALAIFLSGDDELDTAFARLLLLATLTRRASAGEPIDRDEATALVDETAAAFDRLGDDYGSAVVRVTDAILAVVPRRARPGRGRGRRGAGRSPAATASASRLSRVSYVLGHDRRPRAVTPRSAYRHIEQSLRLLDELGIHQAVTAQARLLAPLADAVRRARAGRPVAGLRQRSRRRVDPLRRHGHRVGPQPRRSRRPRRRRPRRRRRRPSRPRSSGTRRPASRSASRSPSRASGSWPPRRGDARGVRSRTTPRRWPRRRRSTTRPCSRWRWRVTPPGSSIRPTAACCSAPPIGCGRRRRTSSRRTVTMSRRSPTRPARALGADAFAAALRRGRGVSTAAVVLARARRAS